MDKKQYLLSICIPTYNRAHILDEGLSLLSSQIKKYPVKILVLDNASTDNTKLVCERYPFIEYLNNGENIGADFNILKSYILASAFSDYVCVLGDSYRFRFDIEKLLDKLSLGAYNIVILNRDLPLASFDTGVYENKDEVLSLFGGVMDLTGCIVIKSDGVSESNYSQYTWGNFIHFGLAFSYLSSLSTIKCYYDREFKIYHTSICKLSTSWYSQLFKIFAKNWLLTVMSLPSYTNESKLDCIKNHDYYTGCFSIRNLLNLRKNKIIDYKSIIDYKKYIPFVTDTPLSTIILILKTPLPILHFIIYIYHKMKSLYLKLK